MANLVFIEDTLSEKYPNSINQQDYIWRQLIEHQGVGVGWHDLIIEMTQKIEDIYKEHNIPIENFHFDGMKEKYGGLRVDFRSSIIKVHELISLYENKSETVCEECGEPGHIRDDLNWIQCLCEKCYSLEKKPTKN